MLKVLDLFSGIGGFSLGLERTGGFETVAFCEIDPFCRRVLAKHWHGVPCAEDVTAREFIEGEADVVVGGFPCQDISFAGAGAGLAGARSGLWRELLRAIRVVRPRYAIVENVAALLNRGMGDVLGDLAAIGHDTEWHCIPASHVGAPHRRDRIWIVAYPKSERRRETWGVRCREHAQWPPRRGEAMADADGEGPQRAGHVGEATGRAGAGQSVLSGKSDGWQWESEPDVGRVAHGVPARVDRLRSLGNAVVPQISEMIGHAILQALGEAA